jgi:hypothetical protein
MSISQLTGRYREPSDIFRFIQWLIVATGQKQAAMNRILTPL